MVCSLWWWSGRRECINLLIVDRICLGIFPNNIICCWIVDDCLRCVKMHSNIKWVWGSIKEEIRVRKTCRNCKKTIGRIEAAIISKTIRIFEIAGGIKEKTGKGERRS